MPVPTAPSAPIRRARLSDDVFAALRDAIVDGTLAPGERLRDTELGVWLDVSRTPIREALLRLERDGLVVTRAGRSTHVAPLDEAVGSDAQAVAAALHELAVRTAGHRLGESGLAAMTDANTRFAAALAAGDLDAAIAADDAFHGIATAAAGNAVLLRALDEVAPHLRRIERLRFASLAGRESVAQHAAIVEALRAGDVEAAAVRTRENWHTLGTLLSARRASGAALAAEPG